MTEKATSDWEFLRREWKDGKSIDTKGGGIVEGETIPLKKKVE